MKEYQSIKMPLKIIHQATKVTSVSPNMEEIFEVPKLESIQVSVGAGDAFLAGLIDSYLTHGTPDIRYAISIAQRYIQASF